MDPLRQPRRRANLVLRSAVLGAIRDFFEARDFLEVETPLLIPAPAPEAHIDPVHAGEGYLQTSPELCMKRLLAAGCPRIFQICKCFRCRERGRRHLPEFTMLEWYFAGGDYREMMADTEALLRTVFAAVDRGETLSFQGRAIGVAAPWVRLPVARAFDRCGLMPMQQALASDLFDELMGLEIEPQLGWEQPTFLFDYPAACGALARLKPPDFLLSERFELYIGGLELCNGFTELTDPVEQRRRFATELDRRRRAGLPPMAMPEPFLDDLSRMPPAAGNALGIDRLLMLLADAEDIDEVVTFVPEEL